MVKNLGYLGPCRENTGEDANNMHTCNTHNSFGVRRGFSRVVKSRSYRRRCSWHTHSPSKTRIPPNFSPWWKIMAASFGISPLYLWLYCNSWHHCDHAGGDNNPWFKKGKVLSLFHHIKWTEYLDICKTLKKCFMRPINALTCAEFLCLSNALSPCGARTLQAS